MVANVQQIGVEIFATLAAVFGYRNFTLCSQYLDI
jgi:hypothetical protein